MVACVTAPALLLVLAASSLGWENLPAIPAGRRAEYYLLNDDGAYRFGYDTGEGQSAAVSADQSNQVQGQYSYVGNAGKRVSIAYTAGDSGFLPRLEGGETVAGTAGFAGPSSGSFKTPVANGNLASDGSKSDENYDTNADASYSFSVDTDSYKRTESSDAKGNIRGQYSYSSQAGGSHGLSYIAGEGTGFVVTGSDSGAETGAASTKTYAPLASSAYSGGPAADTTSNLNNDGSYSFSFNTNDQSREESADSQNNVRGSYSFKAKDDGQTRRVDYTAGSATGFVATGSHLPVPPLLPGSAESSGYFSRGQSSLTSFGQTRPSTYSSASGSSETQGSVGSDGSYSFSYNAGDSSRQETADAQNNVRGSFSFKNKDDGQTRKVDYEAGAATGFVAKGSHLPVAPDPLSSPSTGSFSEGFSSQPSVVSPYSGSSSGSEGEEAPSGDASYSFSYNTGDQSRQEVSDAQGNVNGQFSFVAKDGIQRKVDYTAGAGKGFTAKVSSSGATTSFGPFSQTPVTSYSSEAGSSKSAGRQNDGAYSFSYNAGDHSRQESGDDQNNVRGTYSFTAKNDGQSRRVDYEAGAATGFIAKGAHLPVASSPSGVASGYSSFPSQSSVSSFSTALIPASQSAPSLVPDVTRPVSSYNQPLASSPYSGYGIAVAPESSDGSYSFSFNAGDHSREESSDAQGNTRGRYSFISKDDGNTREVVYEAGADKGFIAKGAHIPASGSAGSASGAFGYQASSTQGLSGSSNNALGYQAPSAFQGVAVGRSQDDQSSGDASYSYRYQTDSSSKQESSDAQGNVVGSFSFLGGDGVSRSVHYTSRGDEGFVVSGEHVPEAVSGGTAGARVGLTASNILPAGAKSSNINSQNVGSLQKYLPPQSPKKFGYIFDTKV